MIRDGGIKLPCGIFDSGGDEFTGVIDEAMSFWLKLPVDTVVSFRECSDEAIHEPARNVRRDVANTKILANIAIYVNRFFSEKT